MADEFKFDWTDFEAKFVRRAASASRPAAAILLEQARGIFRAVIEITPPGHTGVKAGTRAAAEHGKAKVEGDIRALYGTAATAYDRIMEAGKAKASAFWFLHKRGDDANAARVFKDATGEWFGPFDGGAIHRSHFTRGSVKKRKGRPIIYVNDERALNDFIKAQQSHVHWLAGGWNNVARRLGISVSSEISRQNSPGMATVDFTMDHLRVIATNAVAYATDTDLERRIQWAIDRQAQKMENQWRDFVSRKIALA